MVRSLALATLVLFVAGCSRTVPVTVERVEVEHGPNMTVAMESDAVLETSVTPEVEAYLAEGYFGDDPLDDLAGRPDAEVQAAAQAFLDRYEEAYQPLFYASAEAQWTANTRIVPGDPTNAERVQAADEAFAAFTGSAEVIERARTLLAERARLAPLQAKQLDAVLYSAASNPQTVPALVSARIAAEAAQTEALYGFDFTLGDSSVTTNEIDRLLRTATDLETRRAAWAASKAVGPTLTEGLETLRGLRNEVVGALGYDDYFAYQVGDYGMTTGEMTALMQQLNDELRPLYRELHTYVRYELAARYGVDVPEYLPAHWLPNRWGQDWTALVEVEGQDLDGALEAKGPEWMVRQAEDFYQSIGFEPLPASFYAKSSLYPLPPDADYKKNNHASAWHMNLEDDVRCLMSVEANRDWYETTHHELGHIYYYISYTNPDVPLLLRGGANRAYHEAVGSLLGLAALQPRFVEAVGLAAEGTAPDPIQTLLKEALNYVVFIPWSAGVMTGFEHDLYTTDLPPEQWNARWWELKRTYQGIVPPDAEAPGEGRAAVGAPYNDAATKTHINNDAAQYYDYALSYVLLFQLHDHIAREILGEDPRDTNYYGRPEVGAFLETLLAPGATVDGNALLEETTGQTLSAEPMLAYFAPLMAWLQEQNAGRTHTL